MKIVDDPLIIDFFSERELSEKTEERYEIALRQYSEVIQMHPSEFIAEAEKEEDERLRMRFRKVKQYLTKYKRHMEDENKSPKTIRQKLTIIRTFYREYDIDLPKLKIKDEDEERYNRMVDIPNESHIRQAVAHANLKYTAMILTMATSGMGASEILSLTYGDLLSGLTEYVETIINDPLDIGEVMSKVTALMRSEFIIPTWDINRVKTRANYYTFSSPESLYALLEFLRDDPPLTFESPIFRGKGDEPMTLNSLHLYFANINRKCHWGKKGRQIFFRSHNLRKWFASTLYKEGMAQLTIDWFLGHKIDSTTEAYFKSDVNKLKEQYIGLLPHLAINDVHAPKKKIIELERDVSELKEFKRIVETKINLDQRTSDKSAEREHILPEK